MQVHVPTHSLRMYTSLHSCIHFLSSFNLSNKFPILPAIPAEAFEDILHRVKIIPRVLHHDDGPEFEKDFQELIDNVNRTLDRDLVNAAYLHIWLLMSPNCSDCVKLCLHIGCILVNMNFICGFIGSKPTA